jgi:hypothetical protein
MSQTTLQRLLRHPHAAVFDKSPIAELALRVRNPAGLTWRVADGVLHTTTVDSLLWSGDHRFDGSYDWGVTVRNYDLTTQTVGQLVAALRADGHDVVFENAEMAGLGASVLINSAGNQDASNGDHLTGYTSLLWCVLSPYAGEVDAAAHQVGQALRQMVLTQSDGDWLDVWAGLYGVPRRANETDAELQARIPLEVFRLRVNGLAIERAVADLTGHEVMIGEPWKRMFTLSGSALSGDDHLHDGHYYTYHVIQPVGAPGTDWASAMPVLERNKAAGIEIAAPRIQYDARHIELQPPVEYRVQAGRQDVFGSSIYGTNNQILGVMRLSDNEITVNHLVTQLDWLIVANQEGFQTEQQRSIFVLTTIGVETPYTAAGEIGHEDIRAFDTPESYLLRLWTGGWDNATWVPDWRHAGMVRTDTPAL